MVKFDWQNSLHEIPEKLGIYLTKNERNILIYIEKSGYLKKEFASYFSGRTPQNSPSGSLIGE